ncbi:hypothetical protein AV540_14385 [Brevibacillus parabrevis]|uniref:M23 family metallopeptidase n=1 Tax=Brevibacillus parabrevis TaxID=54914 RepID=UPI0007ABF8CB|nr:M23 family metallopeptidase [Brevibacillus parabrevis]KZE49310.1 hypothetical protein AV540_14385 [Brevibacillus parabrevis]
MKKLNVLMCSMFLVGSIFAPSVMAANNNKGSDEEIKAMGSDDPYQNMRWAWPTTSTRITDDYGDVGDRWHKGIDIGVKKKNVYSVAEGKVIQSGHFKDGVTYAITIEHNDRDPDTNKKLITRYLHLEPKELYYTTNEKVKKGTTIAMSGTSGATGYHLHFDVNAKGLEKPGDRDTFSPWVFWPENRPNSLSALDLQEHGEHEQENGHTHPEDEDFFDFLVISYVGSDAFYSWFYSVEESERTTENFKKQFNLSDNDIEEIMNTKLTQEEKAEVINASANH